MRTATLEGLISSGNLNILRNQTFKDLLIKYYEKLERVVEIIHKNNSLFIDQEFVPNIVDIIPIIRPESLNQNTDKSNVDYLNKQKYVPRLNDKLVELTQMKVNHPDYITSLFSSLSLRYDFSMISLSLMTDLKSSTEELITQIPK